MKSPAFQIYPKDFLTDMKAALMSAECFGIYTRLLLHDWIEDGIPSDPKYWLKLGGYNWHDKHGNLRETEDYEDIMAQLSECFIKHPTRKGYVTNSRLQKEREGQEERRKERSESGKKGAKSLWNKTLDHKAKPSFRNGSAIKEPMAKDGSSSSTPSSSTTPIKEEETNTHKELISLWTLKYQEVLQVPYKFNGGKDGMAVKELLKVQGFTVAQFIDLAVAAWKSDKFWCRQSRTISGFSSNFNNIFMEVGGKDIRKSLSDWNDNKFR